MSRSSDDPKGAPRGRAEADRGDRATPRMLLGRRAEALVARRLEDEGFLILDRNARVGRLELDLIARRGDLIVFCEVRARRGDGFMEPYESIDRRKIARIRKAAGGWLERRGPALRADRRGSSLELRFDVASVVFDEADRPSIDYFEEAF